ncbi:Alpha carbonic anhydrase 4 [Striga hermonthica]|uniref:Carbonic anhydrase n=1 Tax=Striga hermonthica TaxID=68872 RepID=A0A9N7NIX3_STRHE|nr:Alpha carbonic anhydrase 4 [Striga hermonthica]
MHFPAIFTACLLLANLSTTFVSSTNEIEVEDEHPFTYEENTEKGPEHWGDLNPNWRVCDTGNFQSPIDLRHEKVELLSGLGQLRRTYKPALAVVRNRGHDIMVQWKGDAGGIIINETRYNLIQCHWHTPSEHRVDGKSFNMELHMVHNNSQGQIAVVGILYALGRPDTFLTKLLSNITSLNDEEGNELGVVNPWEIKFGSRKYYRYIGSLTVPPCTEGVIWTLLTKVRTVSREQLRALRDAVDDGFEENARPTQSLDGRSVYMYHPEL